MLFFLKICNLIILVIVETFSVLHIILFMFMEIFCLSLKATYIPLKSGLFFPFSQSTDEKVYKFRYFKIASSVLFRYSCLSILFLFNEKSFILNVSCNLKKNMLLPVLSLNNELGEGKQLIL